jgi:hypothetical protein
MVEEKKKVTVSFEMPRNYAELVEKVVNARGEDKSSFFRRSVYRELARLGFLTLEDKKALGVTIDSMIGNKEIEDFIKEIPDYYYNIVTKIAKKLGMSVEEYIKTVFEEAKSINIPTHALQIIYRHGLKYNLIGKEVNEVKNQ